MLSKSINTLVQDIYATLEKGAYKIDGHRLGEMISTRLSFSQDKGAPLRMSNLGEKCHRKLWYRANKPETSEPLDGHTILKFLIGDICEEVILSLAEQTPEHTVEGRQDSLTLEGVPGHRDAIIDGVLVDVKSANSRGMVKFTNHRLHDDDPFGYLDQLDAYLASSQDHNALGVKTEAAFLAFDKELGHLVLDKYKTRNKPWHEIIPRLKAMLASPEPPSRYYKEEPDGKSGNMQIPMECRYCQFKKECWKDRPLRKFIYSTGPRWLTKVVRQPEVYEEQIYNVEAKTEKEISKQP